MVRNSVLVFLSKTFSLAIKLLVYLIAARKLGAGAQGTLSLALAGIAILTLITNVGTDMANSRLAGIRPDQIGTLVTNSITWNVVIGVLVAAVNLVLYRSWGSSIYGDLGPNGFWLVELLIPLQAAYTALSGVLVGLFKFREQALGTVLQHGLWLLTVLLSLSGLTPELVILGYCLGVLSAVLLYLGVLWKFSTRWVIDPGVLKEQLNIGSRGLVHGISTALTYRLDLFLVSTFMNSNYVGYYSIASQSAELLLYLPRAVSPALLAAAANEGDEVDGAALARAYRITLSLQAALAAVGVLVAPIVIPLMLGSNYQPAVIPLQLLMIATLPMGIATMTSNHLFGYGKATMAMIGSLVALTATILLDFLLIPTIGISGAAVASICAYTLYGATGVMSLTRSKPLLSWRTLMVPTYADYLMLRQWMGARRDMWFQHQPGPPG